jgi:hypothetical protein
MLKQFSLAALALAFAAAASAEEPTETTRLRQEIERLKQDQAQQRADDAQRLHQMEQRLNDLESRPARVRDSDKPSSGNFNPAISLILDGTYAAFTKDPASYALPGFALAPGTTPGREGLALGESELVISANIDDKFYGSFTAALSPQNETEVEEAYFETLALGPGFTLRGGRFFSGIGYLNAVHAHAWDFTDQPLVYRALLANQYGDDGVQLRWVAPTDLFIEAGAELFRGDSFPAGGAAHAGNGTHTVFVHAGGDVGVSHSWRAGISRLSADASNRESGDPTTPDLFTGSSTLTGFDFVWKWAPNGNPRTTHFKFQTEYFRRHEDGTFDRSSAGTPLPYRGRQRGWYAQAIYQFMPRWRVGLRHDELQADTVNTALAGSALDSRGHRPQRTSLMGDFSNSEFSRFRLQYSRDESRAHQPDNQWYLQYIMSLGAHGAHPF